jgi:D-glutamate cyclase
MTTDEKLAAILKSVQTDPGNRGLARDPHDNLFTATRGDFERACRSVAGSKVSTLGIDTGFYIPNGQPPTYETDGPLGAVFLLHALAGIIPHIGIVSPHKCGLAINIGANASGVETEYFQMKSGCGGLELVVNTGVLIEGGVHYSVALEHAGRASDEKYYSMRARDISAETLQVDAWYQLPIDQRGVITIGIGDGGNEIGMGKIPHETIVKNIPNGDKIHCVVPTDHLIVAGVSNWGAYALAAGIFVLKGITPPPDLFDPDREREILEVMVREGPLVDGVTGKQEATVDGLNWEEYSRPLVEIGRILNL